MMFSPGLLLAQQTGSISGTVTDSDGAGLPGVTIEASSDVLPRARTTVSGASGDYRLKALPPGDYTVKFMLDGMATNERQVAVRLQQNTRVDTPMSIDAITEEIRVVAQPLIDLTSAEVKASISDEVVDSVPVGQEYRDLIKLIPGVQYSEDSVRGPSAGGSGQDNVYQFDGVNVGLPLFGSLSAEPSSHDIEEVYVVRGGAKAIDFDRSGGFTVNSISRSGTSRYRAELTYQVQPESLTEELDTTSESEFEEDKDWTTFSLGGPLVSDSLFFYASYYKPTTTRDNRSNLYGAVPSSESDRDEVFFKLSAAPTDSFLINASYRDSDRDGSGQGVTSESRSGTSSIGSDATLGIATVDATWLLNDENSLNFKYTDFENETASNPDRLFNFPIRDDGSVMLDTNNLDLQGLLLVPQPIDGEDAYNDFIQGLIDRYGYLENGVRVGGGIVGGASTIDRNDFFRESFQIGWDHYREFGNTSHEFHLGYQSSLDEEDLARTSNGWGTISVIGGRDTTADGTPIFYEARFEQQGLDGSGIPPIIHSEFESQSFEINDTIRLADWTVSLGVLVSNDQLFGQGLRENSGNVSGFELAPGNKYKMYEVDWEDLVQPRASVVRSIRGKDSVYASYARYNPAASSLPRAASWGRNLRRSIRGFFDVDGNLVGLDPVGSSSGKFFQDDLEPRSIDEYIVGYSSNVNDQWTVKGHVRHRYGANFWEDTNNTARSAFLSPTTDADYIPELDSFREEIGGSSYVIAQLDGAFTKYYEASVEAERRTAKSYIRGSYVWSHYYGNFDQDNSTTENDANTFVGSSFIADGAGRQLWNNREGNLRGDRRHQLKIYGFYQVGENGTAGAYAVFQSGQPWEAWDVEVYRALTGSSSDTSRFAEPAGSRTTDDHYQIDLSYSHNFRVNDAFNIRARADVFNAFDNQTGYNIQNKVNSSGFGDPRSFFRPRRIQLAVSLQFN